MLLIFPANKHRKMPTRGAKEPRKGLEKRITKKVQRKTAVLLTDRRFSLLMEKGDRGFLLCFLATLF